MDTGSGALGIPVRVGSFRGAFVARLFVTEVEKFALSPRAAANSFKVFKAPGAPSTKAFICVFTSLVVAKVDKSGGVNENIPV